MPEELSNTPLAKLRSREFRQVAEAVRSGNLEGEVLKTLDRITKNWQADLQAYTVGLARMKAVSVTKILEVILKVQDEIAHRIDLKKASLGELTALLRVMRDINNEDVNFIHDLAFGKGEKFQLLVQDNRVAVGTLNAGRSLTVHGGEVSPEGRERLRKLMDGLMDRVQKGEKVIDVTPKHRTN